MNAKGPGKTPSSNYYAIYHPLSHGNVTNFYYMSNILQKIHKTGRLIFSPIFLKVPIVLKYFSHYKKPLAYQNDALNLKTKMYFHKPHIMGMVRIIFHGLVFITVMAYLTCIRYQY